MPEFAIKWFEEAEEITRQGKYYVLLAPRNHAKTWTLTIFGSLWKVFTQPFHERMVFSYNDDQAKNFLSKIANIVEHYFKDSNLIKQDNWSKTTLGFTNGAIIKAGSLSSVRYGYHPNSIVLDDILGGEGDPQKIIKTTLPPGFVEERIFGMVIPMLSPDSQFIITGIPFYQGDIYDQLEHNPEFVVKRYPAIIDPISKKVLWESERPYDYLIKQRNAIGQVRFAREYMLKPFDEKSSLIPYSIISQCFDYSLNITPNRVWRDSYVIVAIDFAISGHIGADYTAIIVMEYKEGKVYIRNVIRFKESDYEKQIETLINISNKYEANRVVVEQNNFQKIYAQNLKRQFLPIYEHHTHTEKNTINVGIPSLRFLFENGNIVIPYNSNETRETIDPLVNELQGFIYTQEKVVHIGKHDDLAMAFYLGIQGLRNYTELIKRRENEENKMVILKEHYDEQRFWENL